MEGICEGKCLALCYKVIIDFPQQGFAGPLSRNNARKIRVANDTRQTKNRIEKP